MHTARSLIRCLRRRAADQTGQSLVELGLILPVFLMFFAAVLDLGRVAAAQVTVTNVAREAAFQAALTPNDFDNTKGCGAGGSTNLVICRALLEAKSSPITVAPADVSLSCSPSCTSALGNRVTVTVVGHFDLITPILSAFFGGTQDLQFTASSTHQVKALPAPSAAPQALPSLIPPPDPSATPTPTPTPTSPSCQLPSAGFTYTLSPAPPNNYAPVMLTVVDTSTSISCGITSWFWQFGDGAVSSVQNPPPHVYTVKGKYIVTLTVANAAGQSTSGKVQILVKQ